MLNINYYKIFCLLFNQIIYSGKNFVLTVFLGRIVSKYEFGIFSLIAIGLINYQRILNSLLYEPLPILLNKSELSLKSIVSFLFPKQCIIHLFLIFFVVSNKLLHYGSLSWNLTIAVIFYYIMSQFYEYTKRIRLSVLKTNIALFYDISLIITQFVLLTILYIINHFTLELILTALSLGYIPCIIFSCKSIPLFADTSNINMNSLSLEYRTYVKPNTGILLLDFCSGHINNFIIFIVLGSSSLANCEAIRMLMIPLHVLNMAMGNILIPYYSSKVATLSKNDNIKNFYHTLFLCLLVIVPCSLLIIFFSPLLTSILYDNKYQGLNSLVIIYSFIYFFDSLQTILICYIKSNGLMMELIKIKIIGSVTNVVLLLPLLLLFNAPGALGSRLVVGILFTFFYYNVIRSFQYS